MSVLVNVRNEKEEKILLAFLDSLRYSYQNNIDASSENITRDFLDAYNKEIDIADGEIEAGKFVSQDEVEQLFSKRRKVT